MHKVLVHPVADNRTSPLADGQLDLEQAIERAGWHPDDPGVGVCVIDEHGREIPNPARVEEPADIEAGQDMMQVLERRIIERLRREAGLGGDEDIEETEEEAKDFAVGDDIHYVSGFEVEMADEWPAMPTPAPRPGVEPAVEEPVRDDDRSGSDEEPDVEAEKSSREAAKSILKSKSKSKERDPSVDH